MELGASRHLARQRALELLYEADAKARPVTRVLDEQAISPDPYARLLLESAERHRGRAEDLISRHAHDWPLERLAVIDRLVMVLAIGEMLSEDPPPMPVILNEAVELAGAYSTEGSAAFVNGVLAAVAREITGT